VRRKFYFEEGEKGFVRLHVCFPKSLPSPAEYPFVSCAFTTVSLPLNNYLRELNNCFAVLLP
jgi:hypothetical protein